MKKYKNTQKKKAYERAGFYVALSVCLMAVGMAAWSAYSALSDNAVDSDSSYFSSLSSATVAVGQDMTGVTESETAAETQQTETQIPTQEQTQPQEKTRSFSLSETMPEESDSAEQKALTTMQAVMKVDDSLVYPVKSRKVTKEYSEDSVYNSTMKDYRAHTGCDFAAEEGENVYAMSGGTVKDISVSELYGAIVEVDCGDYTVYYCGLSNDFSVENGYELKAGDTIGKVGKIPSEISEGSHIHIEIRVGDKLIDPLSVIESED